VEIDTGQPLTVGLGCGGFIKVFSLAHGSVHDELNMKSRQTKKYKEMPTTVLKVR